MGDLGSLLTAGILATALPVLMGALLAYSIIATILGTLLWTAKSVPDDIAIAVTGSGIAVGGLMVLAAVALRLLFS